MLVLFGGWFGTGYLWLAELQVGYVEQARSADQPNRAVTKTDPPLGTRGVDPHAP
jgi:hypothetical protein